MPRDAVSRTANVERNGGHKWVQLINPGQVWDGVESNIFSTVSFGQIYFSHIFSYCMRFKIFLRSGSKDGGGGG